MTVFLVKPHPPEEILNQSCPVPEKYKYAWEPVSLKIISFLIKRDFPDAETQVWHLIKTDDDQLLLDAVEKEQPDFVLFTEIDVLVTQINILAKHIREINSSTIILVGGKQSSALRNGDAFPFKNIDAAFRGGPDAVLQYIHQIRNHGTPDFIKGLIRVDSHGIVSDDNSFSGRSHLYQPFDNVGMRKIQVVNQPGEAYIRLHQSHPSILNSEIRTSPVYSGEGCPYQCIFCQSPMEFGHENTSLPGNVHSAAREIEWLIKTYHVNNFFFLEPNLNLDHLLEIYTVLDSLGIDYASVSGFIRAGDIVKYHRKNILGTLAKKGLRIISLGIDIPADSRLDVYKKSFSFKDMMEALDLCRAYGIIVLATAVGDPDLQTDDFRNQLSIIKSLPIADIDIRLAIPIRNTEYFQKNKKYMLYHPNTQNNYFDRQNYRYQTLQFPGKITPDQTYALVKELYHTFFFDDDHIGYVADMLERFPDTLPFFRRQYQEFLDHPDYYKAKKLFN